MTHLATGSSLLSSQKRILIFDSINFDAGERLVPTIRKLLRTAQLITKRDKCEAMRTRGQSERECRARMVTSMVEIGRLMKANSYNFTTFKRKLDNFLHHAWSMGSDEDEHIFARTSRNTISTMLLTK